MQAIVIAEPRIAMVFPSRSQQTGKDIGDLLHEISPDLLKRVGQPLLQPNGLLLVGNRHQGIMEVQHRDRTILPIYSHIWHPDYGADFQGLKCRLDDN